jgi:DNA repair exonuclease SbcCD ATPase subunit
MSFEKKLEQLEEKFTNEISELKNKNKEYDELFKQLYDVPVIVAQISAYTEDLEKLTAKISRFTGEANDDLKMLQKQIAKKEQELNIVFEHLKRLRNDDNLRGK